MKKIFKKLSGLERKATIPVADEDGVYDEDEETEDETAEEEEYDDEIADEEDDGAEEAEIEVEEEAEEDEDEDEKAWLATEYEEGQLSIDVYQTPGSIIVKSTIAGVKPEDIDISINNDMLTIRGKREMQEKIENDNYLFRECYWGSFSRSIILPMEVVPEKIEAFLENGVLTVTLPKAKSAKQISIKVKER
jgi:HSP20 family protein